MVTSQFALGSRIPVKRDVTVQLDWCLPKLHEFIIALKVGGMLKLRTTTGIYVQHIHSPNTLSTPTNTLCHH